MHGATIRFITIFPSRFGHIQNSGVYRIPKIGPKPETPIFDNWKILVPASASADDLPRHYFVRSVIFLYPPVVQLINTEKYRGTEITELFR